jgi:ClpP class serine protease
MTTTLKRPADNVLHAMMALHWAILPESLELMVQIVERQTMDLEQLEKIRGEPLDNTYETTIRDGVATIPVTGPLFRYASFFNRISGATTYADLATDLQAALADPRIKAIILSIDSPGGEVNGNAELAAQVFAARGKKPIVAYVSNLGASAAYWLASAADTVIVASTAIVGSIGTVATIRKAAAPGPNQARVIEIVSTQSPSKRLDPETDMGRAALQQTIDAIADVFVNRVAEYRGVSRETVLADFGQGGVLVGDAAVRAGLADGLGDYESLHAELRDRGTLPMLRRPTRGAVAPRTSPALHQETESMETSSPAAAPAASTPTAVPATVPAAPPNPAAAVVPAAAPSAAPTIAEAFVQARTEERERILAIQKLGRPGEEAVIAACVADPTCTPAQAALKLRAAEAGRGADRLAQLRTDENRGTPAHAATTEVPADVAQTEAASILAVHRQVTGAKS